MAKIQ
ncbi:portal domain protein, partial [Escherichia coli 8.2524]|jgi:hypothetical protein